jgi:hypothetical protein
MEKLLGHRGFQSRAQSNWWWACDTLQGRCGIRHAMKPFCTHRRRCTHNGARRCGQSSGYLSEADFAGLTISLMARAQDLGVAQYVAIANYVGSRARNLIKKWTKTFIRVSSEGRVTGRLSVSDLVVFFG